ncbi:MAG: pentapeptide repeat-containing protein [Chloroflexi bacterium]|nr:pentapeptide repeat-containing protein [Chloroflexota bacterium]
MNVPLKAGRGTRARDILREQRSACLQGAMRTMLSRQAAYVAGTAAQLTRWIQRSAVSILYVLAIVFAAGVLIYIFEGTDWPRTVSSRSVLARNVGLALAGFAALWVAVWRSRIAERQANTAERGLLNERFQRGAEMLGSAVLSVRIAGIHALRRLAEDHPDEYHTQTMRVFCAFVRRPTVGEGDDTPPDPADQQPSALPHLRDDVQSAMEAISVCHERHWRIEIESESGLDLHGAELRGARLQGANLAIGKKITPWEPLLPFSNSFALATGVNLSSADLSLADLMRADLQFADLRDANLSGARLAFAELYGVKWGRADLRDADLSGAHFSNPEAQGGYRYPGPSQEQLDQACADPDVPPRLDDLTDPESGQPLVWRGKHIEDVR